jgi:hypothetical protein
VDFHPRPAPARSAARGADEGIADRAADQYARPTRWRWRSQPSATLWAGHAVLAVLNAGLAIVSLWREPGFGVIWLILSGMWAYRAGRDRQKQRAAVQAARAGGDPPRDTA